MNKIKEQNIKAFISKHVFPDDRCGSPDQTILRQIIFDPKNKVDWQKALMLSLKYMPELLKAEELENI